jgi:hypothetical protein
MAYMSRLLTWNLNFGYHEILGHTKRRECKQKSGKEKKMTKA